jgi:hypothetical protein
MAFRYVLSADLLRKCYRMSKRRVALILSFIYCGLGQAVRGEILKAISFIIIFTLLIISTLLSSSPFPRFFGFAALLLMWIVGILDAYIDEEVIMERKQWLIWQRLFAVLPVAVASGAIVTLLILWSQNFSAPSKRPVSHEPVDEVVKTIPDTHIPDDVQAGDQSDVSEFFSIQVAAFKDSEKAKEFHQDLLSKAYPARIEYPKSEEEGWYRILVGKFQSKQDAVPLAERLSKQEELTYIIVHCPSPQTE